MILIGGLILAIMAFSVIAQKYLKTKRSGEPQVIILVLAFLAGGLIFGTGLYITAKGTELCEYELMESKKYALSYKMNEYGYDWKMDGTVRSRITFYYIDEGSNERSLELPIEHVTFLDTGFKGFVRIEKYSISMLKALLFIKSPTQYRAITKL